MLNIFSFAFLALSSNLFIFSISLTSAANKEISCVVRSSTNSTVVFIIFTSSIYFCFNLWYSSSVGNDLGGGVGAAGVDVVGVGASGVDAAGVGASGVDAAGVGVGVESPPALPESLDPESLEPESVRPGVVGVGSGLAVLYFALLISSKSSNALIFASLLLANDIITFLRFSFSSYNK